MSNILSLSRTSSIVFLLSGASALIFETVWFRVTSTVLGSSVWSAAAVLMAFMAGLGIGNIIVALQGHRIRNPAWLYVVVEIVIGVSGVAAIVFLPWLSSAIAVLLAQMIEHGSMLNMTRFAIAFLVLLIPAIAMGSTLPIMQKALQEIDKSFSYSIARLYGWNTMGAVFGTLGAEFFLIDAMGLKGSGLFACSLNLLAAMLLFRCMHQATISKTESLAPPPLNLPKSLLIGPALAGMFLLALEVIWFRYLTLVHFETSTLFAIMLAVVLVGISLGGLIVARTGLAEKDIDKALFYLPLAATLTVILGFVLFQLLTDFYLETLTRNTALFALAAALLMFPTSLLSGMLFPLYGERLHRTLALDTQSSGMLTFANTMGAALGSGLATFILLPLLGIEHSLLVVAIGYVVLGSISVGTRVLETKVSFFVYKIGACLLIAVAVFPHGALEKSFRQYGETYFPGEKLVAVRESIYATLRYYRRETLGQADSFRLVTNGFSMTASDFASERYMKLFAYLPQVLHGNIEDALLISYGVGNTADAITRLDTVKHFDVVDISKDVIELSSIIDETRDYSPLDDPRVRVNIEDGRFFLETADRKYDLITGEPPPPKSPLIVNLYSKEFFELTREHLNEDGIVSYWLPIHQLLAEDSAAILKAFCDVYPDCSLWNGFNNDFIMLGSNGGIKPVSSSEYRQYWNSGLAGELGNIGIENPAMLGSLFIADSAGIDKLVGDAQPVTDNYPKRISSSIQGMFQPSGFYARMLDIDTRRAAFTSSEYIRSILPADVISESARYFELEKAYMLGAINPHLNYQMPYYWEALTVVLENTDMVTLPLYLLGSSPRQMGYLEEIEDRDNAQYRALKTKQLLVERNYSEAASSMEAFLADGNARFEAYYPKLGLVTRALAGETIERRAIDDIPQLESDKLFKPWFVQKFEANLADT